MDTRYQGSIDIAGDDVRLNGRMLRLDRMSKSWSSGREKAAWGGGMSSYCASWATNNGVSTSWEGYSRKSDMGWEEFVGQWLTSRLASWRNR